MVADIQLYICFGAHFYSQNHSPVSICRVRKMLKHFAKIVLFFPVSPACSIARQTKALLQAFPRQSSYPSS